MILGGARVIAVIRLQQPLPLVAARAIVAGGISAIELTLTTPGALDSIRELTDNLPDCLIGAGTVLDEHEARAALAAGARFCVGPTYSDAVHALCRSRAITYVPGAFTPTEVLHAHRQGAELIKLSPSNALGPQYLRDVRAPMPFLKLIPSGGISRSDAADWIRAGAVAVSAGTSLLADPATDPATLLARARELVAAVHAALPG